MTKAIILAALLLVAGILCIISMAKEADREIEYWDNLGKRIKDK